MDESGGDDSEGEQSEDAEGQNVLLTDAKKKRGETERARGYYKKADRIAELKKRLPCSKCGKLGHWAKECPSGDAGNGKTYMLGFLGYASYEMRVALRVRYPLQALVDTACAKCVMGGPVASEYTRIMKLDHDYEVERVAEKEPYQFGPSRTVHSQEALLVPLRIGTTWVMLRVSVISEDVPFLLSKNVLRALRACVDLDKLCLVCRGMGTVPLEETTSGHVALRIVAFDGPPQVDPAAARHCRGGQEIALG